MTNEKTILVGYDGSAGANLALAWALDEAARTGGPVRLGYGFEWLTAYSWLGPAVGMGVPPNMTGDAEARRRVAELLDDAVAKAAGSHPGVSVSAEVLDGPPVSRLLDASAGAAMLVLGSRGHGGFTGLLTGSTTVALTAHAHCPVVVVREGPGVPSGPVLVGVDGSEHSLRALDFAAGRATARGLRLSVVRALPAPEDWPADPADRDAGAVVARAQAALDDLVHRSSAAGLEVSTEVVLGSAAEALIQRSRDAALVVVGSRGRGGFTGLLLGSVSQQLLQHAHCPIAVVRELAGQDPPAAG
ncbi:universal stress protein [Plantactinospora sp. KBS50]|uniref:universal stress protein n=1 Tax=Plantactinospora sp. KBS50 TaxID=2024580 RepID=UPI000BAAD598|nr:universal stress protein [Plantactinospora sp. KBS50]ASW54407.1 universal stress protein UspA [Plantactinospora sp. KBS50]